MMLYWNLAWFLLETNYLSWILLVFSFEKIVANVTEREVSEEELEFNSDYSYDYDTDSSNDE